MPDRPSVKSAFENLRPTILREPNRSAVSAEAEARLFDKPKQNEPPPKPIIVPDPQPLREAQPVAAPTIPSSFSVGALLQKKKRERLLLVSFRMPQGLKERLEDAAKRHELNQTDLINEGIELNLQRYL